MSLVKSIPDIPVDEVYTVKETCAILGIARATLLKCKRLGWIRQINSDNTIRPRYTGAEIRRCWENIVKH